MTPGARRVLVVDDDDDLRASIVETLADQGWEVAEARDGAEALAVARAVEPAVMLLDWRMPVLDGGEVLDRLADLRARVRVVLVTASAHVRQLAAAHGVHLYLGKPFGVDELLAVMAQADGG